MFFMIKINLIKCKRVFFSFRKSLLSKYLKKKKKKAQKHNNKKHKFDFSFFFISNFYDVNKLLKLFSMYLKLV